MSPKADRVLSNGHGLHQLYGCKGIELIRRSHHYTRCRNMATSNAMQNGHNPIEQHMGASRIANWKEASALQIGIQVQICIWFRQTQIQSSTHCHGRKGFSFIFLQEHGVDYDEIFSPVVKITTLLLGVIAMEDLELEQLDVKSTFLHGDMEEDIYMSQPKGFRVMGVSNTCV